MITYALIAAVTIWLVLTLIYEFHVAPEVDDKGNVIPGPGLRADTFAETNTVYAKDQPQYRQLPAFRERNATGCVVTCWRLPFWERVKVLFTGQLWCSIMTFNRPLQPLYFSVHKHDVLIVNSERINNSVSGLSRLKSLKNLAVRIKSEAK